MTMVVAGSSIAFTPTEQTVSPPTYTPEVGLISSTTTIEQQIIESVTEANSDLSPEPKYEEPFNTSILCNCYKYVDSVVDLPHSSVIRGNIGDSGNVAVFYYPESRLYHYAYVVHKDKKYVSIQETNYHHCAYGERVIRTDYPYLLGFFSA